VNTVRIERLHERLVAITARYPTHATVGQQRPNARTRRLRVRLLAVGAAIGLVLLLSRVALPPTPSIPGKNAHWALQGVMIVAGQPRDIDLVNLRDTLDVGGVIDVRPDASPLDAAVARSFGVAYLELPVKAGGVPGPRQLAAAADFVQRRVTAHKAVVVYDEFGLDQAPLTAALLLVLHGQSERAALRHAFPGPARPTHLQLRTVGGVALLRRRGVAAGAEITPYRAAARHRW
jgi:hypothetical protein